MRGKYSSETFCNLPREVKDYTQMSIICNPATTPCLSRKVHFGNLYTQSREQSVHCHRACTTYACEITPLAPNSYGAPVVLRNRRLSLRREGRITGRHWSPLFISRASQCRVSRRSKSNLSIMTFLSCVT